jgi:ParB family transcriptional regulator, chromosome partitioning protein
MGKLDELKRTAGGNVAESASRRETPVLAAATLAGLNPARMEGVARSKAALEIPLEKIERDPTQPREEFDEEALARLAESIKARGLLQPVRVRWSEERGRYMLIAGERRWRAAEMAGLPTLTCIVDEKELTPAELLADQVTENLLREDLNPMERARAFRTLMDLNGWSGNQLAKELGISQSSVVQALAPLKLPEPVQEMIEREAISAAAAYEVSKLDDPALQAEVAQAAVAENLKRSEVAELVQAVKARRPAPKARPEPITIDLGDGCTVTVRWKKAGELTALQALRKATKALQEQEAKGRAGEAA